MRVRKSDGSILDERKATARDTHGFGMSDILTLRYDSNQRVATRNEGEHL